MLYKQELGAVIEEIMTRWDVPGLAVAVVQGDEIVYAEAFGVQSLETRRSVTPDSIFCVASVSKCFVATAMMQMAERGNINLDAPLTQYLPYFRMDDERYQQITLRQMLSHTSGMPDMDEHKYHELLRHPEWDEGAAERYVRGLGSLKLIANPGERFSYSNVAYNVLGDVLAKVSGKPFESAMQENILLPSGMPNSTFLLTDVPPDFLAVPHLRSPEMRVNLVYPYHRADAPASFLHTTAIDMCHWGVTCLGRGSYLGRNILLPTAYDLMWKPVADRGSTRPSIYEEIGLGWTLGHLEGAKVVSHGGAGFGWSAFLLILPEKNSAAVVLCNEESYSHVRIVHAIGDVLIGERPKVNTVSWMVPISRALAEGGIRTAYSRYNEMKTKGECEYYFDEEDLVNLAFQLFSVGKLDLAIEVLGLNIHVFPGSVGSYLEQAKIYLEKGDLATARHCLLKALSIQPGNTEATRVQEQVRSRRLA